MSNRTLLWAAGLAAVLIVALAISSGWHWLGLLLVLLAAAAVVHAGDRINHLPDLHSQPGEHDAGHVELQAPTEVRQGQERFEVYRAKDGWRWRLIAGNGQIIATGEAYTRERDAWRAVVTVKRVTALAEVRDAA